jgi:hypothetical protein
MNGDPKAIGAVIDTGPTDWQILQQGPDGLADVALTGRWGTDQTPLGVDVRVVHQDTNAPVTAALDWTAARMRPDGTWSAELRGVPAGGLYRLQTRLGTVDSGRMEGARRGDMRNWLGVGDLWVIAGQSNSSGHGRGTWHDPPRLGVHLFNNAMRWTLATHPLNDATDTAHPVNTDGSNPAHAPWLRWAKRISAAVGFPIGLVQTSLGGSPLSMWDPAEGDQAVLFEMMMQVVRAVGGSVGGVLWYQGESDAQGPQAESYAQRFVRAVRAWREALDSPDLPVLTVQINRKTEPAEPGADRGWSLVREAQRRAARRLANVTIVPSLDLPLSDAIHTSPAGNMVLADRAAAAALGAVYGRDVDYLAPEPLSARWIEPGRVIELSFANVSSRLDAFARAAQPFRVEDAGGVVELGAVEYTGGSALRLRLLRPATGHTCVHGAYGGDPQPVPCDVLRGVPMLGFYGLAVEGAAE